MKTLRALLVLGRVSNLPTIWSNCLCGWLIGVGLSDSFRMDWAMFAWLASGATAMYLGGMVLNDACDVAFDYEHRPERPIPSGAIEEKTVWYLGVGLLATGTGLLAIPGGATALLALANESWLHAELRNASICARVGGGPAAVIAGAAALLTGPAI